MKAVILCGGLATRMLPITKTIPKEMLPVLTRPAIDYCIEDLRNNGIKDVLVVIGRGKESIENYYDRNIELEDRLKSSNKIKELESITSQYKDMNISFIRQIEAKGTGYATNLARNFVGNDHFIVMFPDDIIIGDSFVKQLIDAHTTTGRSIIPLKKINIEESHKYGMVGISDNNSKYPNITEFVEKPSINNTPSDICYTGSGLFAHTIFDHLASCPTHTNGEQYLTDAFTPLIQGNNLCGTIIQGTRLDIGSPLGFVKGNILAALQDNDLKADLVEFIKSLNI